MTIVSRLVNNRLLNCVSRPRISLCVRKDLFPTAKLADQFTEFIQNTGTWYCGKHNNGYARFLSIPFLWPKACYCNFTAELNMSKCICSPLESCVAIHVEVTDSKSSVSLEPLANEITSSSVDKKSFMNFNVNTHLIVSQLSNSEHSHTSPIQLIFKENTIKQFGRTSGEYIGRARLSILDLGLDPDELMPHDIFIVQASDKELGIDEEWDRIKKWARRSGP